MRELLTELESDRRLLIAAIITLAVLAKFLGG